MILLDTNILIYSKQAGSAFHPQVTGRLQQLAREGNDLAICPQVIYEFYRFATAPAEGNRGFGLSPENALDEVLNLTATYSFLDETGTFHQWPHIMSTYQVRGKQSHDARLVATMRAHGIQYLYTLNTSDFTRFQNIITLI